MVRMDAVQHADAVTRRVESLAAGHVVALSRVLPGRPRTVWPVLTEVLTERVRELVAEQVEDCLLYTSPSPRDRQKSRMPSSA